MIRVSQILGHFSLIVIFQVCNGYFENCDYSYLLKANSTQVLESPYYPDRYPGGSSCRTEFTAPIDYGIQIECNISIFQQGDSCSFDWFYIATDGDRELRNSNYYCGNGNISRTSLFNSIVVAYISKNVKTSGTFRCLLTTFVQPCDCGWSINKKILGGIETKPNEFPFVAVLKNRKADEQYCSASIISHRYLVTAAHCMQLYPDPIETEIIVGEHSISQANVSRYYASYYLDSIILHPKYDDKIVDNDIAILKTVTNIQWSLGVGPICLPFLYTFADYSGYYVTIIGWGTTFFAGPKSDNLLKATVLVLANGQCKRTYEKLKDSQICTASEISDSCQFDSGGSLSINFQRTFIVGIISKGYACGVPPAVNTRISSYLDWIQKTTNANFCRKT